MATNPPAKLIPLLVGRGKFPSMWKLSGRLGMFEPVALALAELGWSVDEIAQSLASHPDWKGNGTKAKEAALAACAARFDAMADVRPLAMMSQARIVKQYLQRPRSFLVELDGHQFELPSGAFGTPRRFKDACFEACGKMPQVVSGKEWDGWVQAQVDSAEAVEQPDEVSEDGARLAIVEALLHNLGITGDLRGLSSGSRYIDDGRQHIHSLTIFALAQSQIPHLTTRAFHRALRDLGWQPSDPHTTERKRLWQAPYSGPAPDSYAKLVDEQAEARRLELAQAEPSDDSDDEWGEP